MEDPPPVLESTPELFYEINVIQTNDGDLNKLFMVQNSRQIRLYTDNCENVTFRGTIVNGYNAHYVINGAVPGNTYVVSVKYDVKSLLGALYTGGDLSSTYTFSSYTKVGANAPILVPTSVGTIEALSGCRDTTPLPGDCPSSNIVAENIGLNDSEIMFTTYPVPFKENLTIRYNFNYQSKARIEMYDYKGTILMSYDDPNAYNNKEVILTPAFNIGEGQMYFIKVITDREVSMKKVISRK